MGFRSLAQVLDWVTLTDFTNFSRSAGYLDCEATNSPARFYRAFSH